MKIQKKGEVVEVIKSLPGALVGSGEGRAAGEARADESGEDMEVRVRYTSGEVGQVPRASVSLQKQRSPIDAWPDAFIFFDRVLGLLRGLTASLSVSVSYLEVMMRP